MKETVEKDRPIPCLGRWVHTIDGSDYDCDYENAGGFGCEDCIVNGGRMDPRTGKKFASKGKGVAHKGAKKGF